LRMRLRSRWMFFAEGRFFSTAAITVLSAPLATMYSLSRVTT